MIFLFVCLVFVFLLMYGIEIQPSNGVSECWDAGLAGEYGEDSGGNYGSTQLILGIYIFWPQFLSVGCIHLFAQI